MSSKYSKYIDIPVTGWFRVFLDEKTGTDVVLQTIEQLKRDSKHLALETVLFELRSVIVGKESIPNTIEVDNIKPVEIYDEALSDHGPVSTC